MLAERGFLFLLPCCHFLFAVFAPLLSNYRSITHPPASTHLPNPPPNPGHHGHVQPGAVPNGRPALAVRLPAYPTRSAACAAPLPSLHHCTIATVRRPLAPPPTSPPPHSRLIAYCAGTGGSILIIGSAAGVAFMGMEKANFGWYVQKVSPYALAGYLSGIGVYIGGHGFNPVAAAVAATMPVAVAAQDVLAALPM